MNTHKKKLSHRFYIILMMISIACVALLAPGLRPDSLHVAPESLKTAWSVAGILVFLTLWVLSHGLQGRASIKKISFYYPIIGFLVWCSVSLFWVINDYFAFLELIKFYSVAIAFFIVINSVDENSEIKQMFIFLILSSVLVSLLGLMQLFFRGDNSITSLVRVYTSIGATFGNKNMASHFMVMTIPLSLVFIVKSNEIGKKLIFTIAFCISVFFLVLTFTQTGLLALIIELIVFSMFLFYDKGKNKKVSLVRKRHKHYFITFFIFIMLISSFSYFSIVDNSYSSAVNSRIKSLKLKVQHFQIQDNPRLSAWKNTLGMVKEHPFTGVGVGQWASLYPLYYDRVAKDVIFNEKIRLRHLHNDYIEMLANVGILGVGFLIWLLLLTMRAAYKVLSDPDSKGRYLTLALVLGLIGFAVSSMFSFPVKVYYPMLLAMVYIALIANIYFRNTYSLDVSSENTLARRDDNDISKTHYYVLSKMKTKILLLVLILLAVATSTISYKWLMGQHYFNLTQAVDATKYDDPSEKSLVKLETIEQSIISNPYNSQAQFLAGHVLIENKYIDEGIEYLEKNLKGSPYQTFTLSALFRAYILKKDTANKLRIAEKYMDVDPRSVLAHAYATSVYMELGRGEDAKRVYNKMKDNYLYFKGRRGFGPYYSDVGSVAQAVGDIAYAKEVFSKAIKKFPKGAEYHKKMGGLYYLYPVNKGEKKKGIELLKQALKLNPKISGNKEIKELISKYAKNVTSSM